jgi:hypothetical protein
MLTTEVGYPTFTKTKTKTKTKTRKEYAQLGIGTISSTLLNNLICR